MWHTHSLAPTEREPTIGVFPIKHSAESMILLLSEQLVSFCCAWAARAGATAACLRMGLRDGGLALAPPRTTERMLVLNQK